MSDTMTTTTGAEEDGEVEVGTEKTASTSAAAAAAAAAAATVQVSDDNNDRSNSSFSSVIPPSSMLYKCESVGKLTVVDLAGSERNYETTKMTAG